jgi:carbon-monoxide dehydrogenase large subunit
MIVADRTGVAIEDIDVIHGDTDAVRSSGLTVGSRSVQIGGAAIASATAKLVDAARERAADLLAAAADVVLDEDTGRFHVTGTRPVGRMGRPRQRHGAGAETDHTPTMPTFPFGAHVAVVEIEPETGVVTIERWTAVDDFGKQINPMVVEGQVHGGIAQGAAQVLQEEIVYDADGQPRTTNFADYAIVSAADLPSFELVPMETPTFANALGAKGVGESGTIGSIPAVYNAVVDALAHLGVRHLETPATPERIWRAIRAGAASNGGEDASPAA